MVTSTHLPILTLQIGRSLPASLPAYLDTYVQLLARQMHKDLPPPVHLTRFSRSVH